MHAVFIPDQLGYLSNREHGGRHLKHPQPSAFARQYLRKKNEPAAGGRLAGLT
jgi:hypothetical protein